MNLQTLTFLTSLNQPFGLGNFLQRIAFEHERRFRLKIRFVITSLACIRSQ